MVFRGKVCLDGVFCFRWVGRKSGSMLFLERFGSSWVSSFVGPEIWSGYPDVFPSRSESGDLFLAGGCVVMKVFGE